MTGEEQSTTLADQAASWVPPWARQPESEPTEPAPAATTDAAGAVDVDVFDEPEATPAADVVTEPEAAGEPELTAEADEPAIDEPEIDVADVATPEPVAGADDAAAEPEPVVEAPGIAEAEPAEVASAVAEVEPVEEAEPIELRGPLEAIMLVVDEPVTEVMLAQVLEQPTERVAATLAELATEYTEQGRGFELRKVAGGWRLYTRGEFAAHVEKFVLDGQQVRLTQAALETLAVIAYKQPVTRSRISAIRGVNCDGVVRTLIARGLIEECGSEPDSGAFLYRTTVVFLEKLGLDSIEELPPLAPFLPDDVEEIANAQG
jgi:segregation and condensation protein B